MRTRSFCIKAGTHAPSHGDGYLYAPLGGRQADIFENILKTWERKSAIQQHEVQVLLWALIAKANFNQMNAVRQATTVWLMKPAHMARINKMAILRGAMQVANFNEMPQETRFVLDAEDKLRQAFYRTTASYQDFERLAMRAVTAFVDNPQILRGHWSKHSKGEISLKHHPVGSALSVQAQADGFSERSVSVKITQMLTCQ